MCGSWSITEQSKNGSGCKLCIYIHIINNYYLSKSAVSEAFLSGFV